MNALTRNWLARQGAEESAPVPFLKGHSGASLVFARRGLSEIVRKIAATQSCNARLKAQSRLQRRLLSYGLPFPRVLADGIDDAGLAYFDMDYIPANSLADFIRDGVPFDVRAVIAMLERSFRFFRLTAGAALPAECFQTKLAQIVEQSAWHPACGTQREAIIAMARRLAALSWDAVPSSVCHGDMTLENILFSPERGVVYIDCDDAFASTYWLDAAKLFQDVLGRWCLRNLAPEDGAEWQTAALNLDALAQPLRRMLGGIDPALLLRLPQFAALNLFRTLPYAAEDAVVSYVLRQMAGVLDRGGCP